MPQVAVQQRAQTQFQSRQTGENESVFVLADDSFTDRHGTVVEVSGIDLSQYRRNPIVLWKHGQGDGIPIGRSERIWKSNGKLKARVRYDTSGDPLAERVRQKVKNGTISAASIGFRPHETEGHDPMRITRSELLEWSLVGVPSDPGALVQERSAPLSGAHSRSVRTVSRNELDRIFEKAVEESRQREEAQVERIMRKFT